MHHPETNRDLRSTHLDNKTELSCSINCIGDVCGPSRVEQSADMLQEAFPRNVAANGEAIMAFFNN